MQGNITARFWACGPLCLTEASLAVDAQRSPQPSLITPGHCSNIGEFEPKQRGKNTNRFPNNTFLSTAQTQQGQNEWRHHLFVKVKALETLTESRAAQHEGSPGPRPHTKWAVQPRMGLIQTEPNGHVQGLVATGWCHHELVSFLSRSQSGQAS